MKKEGLVVDGHSQACLHTVLKALWASERFTGIHRLVIVDPRYLLKARLTTSHHY